MDWCWSKAVFLLSLSFSSHLKSEVKDQLCLLSLTSSTRSFYDQRFVSLLSLPPEPWPVTRCCCFDENNGLPIKMNVGDKENLFIGHALDLVRGLFLLERIWSMFHSASLAMIDDLSWMRRYAPFTGGDRFGLECKRLILSFYSN